MSALTEYIERAKVEEVAGQLRRQGYRVETPSRSPFDLIATKGEERLAVEVKALPQLRGRAAELRASRQRALDEGFTEFRLVVASPPHEKRVTVEHLDRALYEHLRDHVSPSLASFANEARVISVRYVDIDGAHVTPDGTDVEGTGVVTVALRDGEAEPDSLPFRFHVLLDRDLRLARVYQLDVDVSSLADE